MPDYTFQVTIEGAEDESAAWKAFAETVAHNHDLRSGKFKVSEALTDDEIKAKAREHGVGCVTYVDRYEDEKGDEVEVSTDEFLAMLDNEDENVYQMVLDIYQGVTFKRLKEVVEGEIFASERAMLEARDGKTTKEA